MATSVHASGGDFFAFCARSIGCHTGRCVDRPFQGNSCQGKALLPHRKRVAPARHQVQLGLGVKVPRPARGRRVAPYVRPRRGWHEEGLIKRLVHLQKLARSRTPSAA
jgi:hypothetical protein